MFSDKNDKDVNSSLIRLLIYHLCYIRFLYCMFPFQDRCEFHLSFDLAGHLVCITQTFSYIN